MGGGVELRSTSTLQTPVPEAGKQASLHHIRNGSSLLSQVSGKVEGTPGMECSSIQIPGVPSVLVKVLSCSQKIPFYPF